MGKWGPLIQHHGGQPGPLTGIKGKLIVRVYFDLDDPPGNMPGPNDLIDQSWPGFYWQLRPKGFFNRRRVRICDDPEYRPIMSYKIWEEFEQMEVLRRIAQDTSVPITGPEFHPIKVKESSHG